MEINKELLNASCNLVEDQNRVLELIRQGADVQCTSSDGRVPLYYAAKKGYHNICKTLLENGAKPNTVDRFGRSPLSMAIVEKNEKIVRLLLENGADPNLKSKYMNNPVSNPLDKAINIAKSSDRIRMLTLLLEYGADVNNVAGKKKPLHWACANRRKDMVEFLLHKGANIDALDANKKKAVDIAKENRFTEIVKLFENDYSSGLLYRANKRGDYDECKALLEKGAFINSKKFDLDRNIAVACEKGHYRIVKLLLDKRPIVINKDNERNPLFLATKNGHQDIVSLLLDKGASPIAKVNGETLLHVATRNNDLELVRFLILRGLNPNIKNYEGYTPLHYAVIDGNDNMVTCLIENFANINLATDEMKTPWQLAYEAGHQRTVDILLKNGANAKGKSTDSVAKKRPGIQLETKKRLKVIDNNMKDAEMDSGVGTSNGGSPRASSQDASNGEDEDSDSDATVDYADPTRDSNDSIKLKLKNRILDSEDVERFHEKMARLSNLVMEVNEKAINLELLEIDLAHEIETLNSFNRKLEKTRLFKGLKGKDAVQELTLKVEESERKKIQLEEEVKTLQSDIPLSKTAVKRLQREIARFIK